MTIGLGLTLLRLTRP